MTTEPLYCIENYIVVERMYKILSKEKIGVKIIWKQKPKEKAIDNIDVPKENQYMVRNTNLLNEYPLFRDFLDCMVIVAKNLLFFIVLSQFVI